MGSSIYPNLAGTGFSPGDLERIEDVVGEFDSENPCYHFYLNNKRLDAVSFNVDWLGANPGQVISGAISGPGGKSTESEFDSIEFPNRPDLPFNEKMDIPDFSADGWFAMYPAIKQHVGSVNAIYELKDFRSLPKLFRRTNKSLQQLRTYFSASLVRRLTNALIGVDRHGWVPPSKRGRLILLGRLQRLLGGIPVRPIFRKKRPIPEVLRDLGHLAPEHFLNWKFAVEPFIHDLAAFATAARAAKKSVDSALRKADGTVQKGHYHRTLSPSEAGLNPDQLEPDPDWHIGGADTYRVVSELEIADYTLSVHYSASFSKEAREIAHELGYWDAIGVTPSYGNLWRAVRWTFVFDWFTRIGTALDRISPKLLEPVVNIHGGSESFTCQLRSIVEVSPWWEYRTDTRYAWNVPLSQPVATRRTKVYVRKNRIPSLLGLPKASDFSTMEKLLALAVWLTLGHGHVPNGQVPS